MSATSFHVRELEHQLRLPRVGVLMGGPSREAEVSRRSGAAIVEGLRRQGFEVVALPFDKPELPAIPDDVDVVFPALHGAFGEDGQVQSLLEQRQLPYVGSNPQTSALILDKAAAKARLTHAGLPVIPGSVLFDAKATLTYNVNFPAILKPNREGSSIGVLKVDDPKDWSASVAEAFTYDSTVIVEEYIPGYEATVGLLDGVALPVVQVVPPTDLYDNDAKYTYDKGETQYFCPPRDFAAPLQRKMQRLAESAYRALGARDLLRVDFRIDERGMKPYVLEANSLPGFTATSLLPKAAAAAGIDFGRLCGHLVLGAWERAHR